MPCCLCYSHLRFQHHPKPFKRFSIAFCVSSRKTGKSKSYILDSEVVLLEAK